MPAPPAPVVTIYKVKLASSLGEHVVSITPSRTTVESTDPNRKVTLSAAFAGGYELDCFTVNGQRINGNAFEILDRSVTVNAVAKKKQTDMEKWMQEIDKMVDEANKKAKEKLDDLSKGDGKKIKELEEKIKGISKGSWNYSNFGASASASALASKYTAITAGLRGYTFVALGVGAVADGAFLMRVGVKSGVAGKSVNNNKWNKMAVLKKMAKGALAEYANGGTVETYGATATEVATAYQAAHLALFT